MDQRDSHCPYPPSSETTARGTGLDALAGKEDPVELDSSLIREAARWVQHRREYCAPLRYLHRRSNLTYARTRSYSIVGSPSGQRWSGQYQVGSLAGAARLLNDNAGVLRVAHEGQKPSVDQKGKCYLEFDFQCEYKP